GEARLPREIPGWGSRLTLELERIVAKALGADPERRFPSAREFRQALLEAVGAEGRPGRAGIVEPGELTVGRDRELAILDQTLERAAAGKVSVLWLHGPLGIGKSRLLKEARWRAQLRGLIVIDVGFLPQRGSLSAAEQILRGLRGEKRAAAPWLSTLAREHGGSSLDRSRRAAAAFLAEAGSPLVLLVDDLEHADRESRLLIDALIDAGLRAAASGGSERGLALIVTSRDPPAGRSAAAGAAKESLRRLRPLSPGIARDLLRTLMRPLEPPDSLLARLAGEARGIPLRLRLLARALIDEHGPAGSIPADVIIPESLAGPRGRLDPSRWGDDASLRILRALAVIERPVEAVELAAASGLDPKKVSALLSRLARAEVVVSSRRGRCRLYYLNDPELTRELSGSVAPGERSRIHRRAAEWLLGSRDPHPRRLEARARHLLAAGGGRKAREAALDASDRLEAGGGLDAAVRLLKEAMARERSREWRLRLAERISDVHARAGDHLEGIADLQPVFDEEREHLSPQEAVRLRRRLGVHYHRAGRPEKAVALLEEARRLAEKLADRSELVFILSEMAEYHTFRGEYARAESLCREGLELLGGDVDDPDGFRLRMEVTLRASLGHLQLRRMDLADARSELEAAHALARRHSAAAERASILNNLGIVYNQLNDFSRAGRAFRAAEKLIAASGERQAWIQTSCNLAVIAAKRGDADAARDSIDAARRLLRQHPGERLEFSVGISGALVDHLLGRMGSAAEAFGRALPLGRKLGDAYLCRFGEVYLAEAHLTRGNYREALRFLRGVLAGARAAGSAILQRMAASRLLLLETILGRPQGIAGARKALREAPRTALALLEAWNDLFIAAAGGGESSDESLLDGARRAFAAIGIPAGARLARVGLLLEVLAAERTARVRSLLVEMEREPESEHRLLRVLEPLARAEASLFLGDLDRCDVCLQEADAAVVGESFPELEWRIELLRARRAERQGDRDGARHHLHRSLQARDLVLRSIPSAWRARYLSHGRFRSLEDLRARVEQSASTPAIAGGRRGDAFSDWIGRSPASLHLLESIDRLRAVDLPVLIIGETGSGKELAARIIHRTGARRGGPFYALPCASLPAELFESELFGYEAGAFTGAEESRPGLLEHVRGGSLLLDEVTDLSIPLQKKLLAVIDSSRVRPLGSLDTRLVDVRFLASSSIEPQDAIGAGRLLADLYYRLSGAELQVPPLRNRREDIPPLFLHFLEHHGRRMERQAPRLSPDAMDCLAAREWPGNVRELETLAVRLLVEVSPGDVITRERIVALLSPPLRQGLFPERLLEGRDLGELRRELEKSYLEKLFLETRGDVPRMLERLGIRRSNLYTWMRKVGIDVAELRRRL
ncbi:MAG: DUF2791 family P-loop domain-containing protein, partial [Planctomycetes bacterium]|nr:DUF2791 family P-loop domain-containing protein [Planctomycetota bacterium]